MAVYKYDLSLYASGMAPVLEDNLTSRQVVFPDLHGNALAFLLKLEAHGILELTEQNRIELAGIYKNAHQLTPDNLQAFDTILDSVKMNPNSLKSLCLIGDVLGDRGKSDLLTLLILKKLSKNNNLSIHIEWSNHDMEFIKWFLSSVAEIDLTPPVKENLDPIIAIEQRSSLNNSISYLEKYPDQRHFIQKLVVQAYLPKLQLLNYSIDSDTNSLTWYTHAPAGFEVLAPFANYFGIAFDDSTLEKKLALIDQINKCFIEELLNKPERLAEKLSVEIRSLYRNGILNIENTHPDRTPFHYIAWNRQNSYLKGVENGCNVHGHMGDKPTAWNSAALKSTGVNLDHNNFLGHSESKFESHYPYGLPGLDLRTHLTKSFILQPSAQMINSKPEVSHVTQTMFHFAPAAYETKELPEKKLKTTTSPETPTESLKDTPENTPKETPPANTDSPEDAVIHISSYG